MTDFVTGTCDVSGQLSSHCVVTHWYAAKEQGFEAKVGTSSARYKLKPKYSNLMDFDICLSEETIRTKLRNWWLTRLFIGLLVWFAFCLSLITGTISITSGSIELQSLAKTVNMFFSTLSYMSFIILLIMGAPAVGFRLRYEAMAELEPLGKKFNKWTAYRVSKKVAEKKAAAAGRDIVWSESRFKEGRKENAWVIE